ncbi:MAG: C25 family cysteine peptidase [Thermoplasmatales archaeon]|nr:C25 family cysteine peptidase [Thermoplasmatales archaeon]
MKSQIPLLIFTFILIIPGIIPPAQAEMQQAVARSDAIDYLIITNESFVGEFKKLADYRESQGYNVKIETVKNITVHEGRDIPEKIRNYLRDMHQNGLRYVLLGGDYEYVPIRYAYPSAVPNPYTSDPYDMLDVPGLTDFYYSSLSERWDYNNNSIFGEYDDGEGSVKWDPNINYSFDLAVGRAPVHNSMDISIFINKTKAFEQRTGAEIGDVALVGEHVASSGEHGLSDGALELEEYFPEVFPSGYNITRFYQPDCIDVSDATLDVINKDTPYLVVNLGHGGGQLILGNYTSNMIPALEASGSAKPFIWLSGSCLVANLTPTNAQDRNAGEGLVLSPYGPAAFIGNTQFGRLGNEKYSSRILESVYSQNITTIGEALLYAKKSIIEDIVSDPWVTYAQVPEYMTVHTLLGDPALKIARHDFPIPKIVFNSPEEGRNLTGGATIEVKWTCENLTENSVMDFGYYGVGLTWVKGIDPKIGYYKCKLPDKVSSTQFIALVVNTSRQRLSSICISPTFLLDSYPPYIINFDYYYDSGHLFLNITSNELLNISSLVEGTLIVDGLNYSGFDMLSAEEVPAGYFVNGRYLLKSLEPIDERHNCTIYFLSSIKDTSYPGHCLAEPASYYVQGNTSSMDDTSIPQFLGQSAVKDSDSIGFQLILANDDGVSSVNLVYRNKSTNNWVYILMTKSDNYKCSISCLNNSYIGYFYLIEYDDKMLTIMEEEKPFEIIFTPSGLIPTEDFNVIDDSIPLTRLPFGFLMAAVGIILIIVACVLAAKDRSKKSHWNQTRKNKK